MQKPLISFFYAILIYISFLSLVASKFFVKSDMEKISLTIEDSTFSKVERHQHSKSFSNLKSATSTKSNKNNNQESVEPNQNNQNDEKIVNNSQDQNKSLAPIYQPLPDIPYEMRSEVFQSKIVARFFVSPAGIVENVQLIQHSTNYKLNSLLIKNLKQWRFNQTKSGFTKDIEVLFEVYQ